MEDKQKFAYGGELSTVTGLRCFYTIVPSTSTKNRRVLGRENITADKFAKKMDYWKGLSGISSKMAHNNTRAAGIGNIMHMDEYEKKELFHSILCAKYTQNPDMRRKLLETGDAYLLEFCKGALYFQEKNGRVERWGGFGKKVEAADGTISYHIYGKNIMGELLMRVRTEMAALESKMERGVMN